MQMAAMRKPVRGSEKKTLNIPMAQKERTTALISNSVGVVVSIVLARALGLSVRPRKSVILRPRETPLSSFMASG
jgi:3-polyprenyl-4-hydroxybenzoate decarboxylase